MVAPWHGGVELEWVVMIIGRFSGMRSVQEKCRMKLPYPNPSVTRSAMSGSSVASENPFPAR